MITTVCLAHPGHDCRVRIHRHHLRPAVRGGERSPTVPLCSSAHASVHDLLDVIEDAAASARFATVHEVVRGLPAEVWSAFPGRERVVAYYGWKQYGLLFLNGRYAAHHRFWRSDGSPRLPDVPPFEDRVIAARHSRRWARELARL